MKLLILRIGALGDVLHALPAVAALRAAYPDWQIDWVIDPRWSPLLINSEGHTPIVSAVHLADTKLWTGSPLSLQTAASLRTLRRTLRAACYDLAVDMQGNLRSAVLGRFAAPHIRAGYADPRESAATLFYTHKLPRTGTHVVDQGANLLSATTGVALTPIPPELPHEIWADQWAAEETTAAPLCLLAPGAGWAAKQWPAENFAELAIQLKAQGFDVAVNAPHAANPLAAQITAASGGAARTIVSNITGLIALTRRAALVIGNDSGPTHLAAVLGTPTLALFGPTDPARNGPWATGPIAILRHSSSHHHVQALRHPPPRPCAAHRFRSPPNRTQTRNLRQ